ncbi:hypothetical protein PoB_005880200 [Plakobranchus ocellatus]|uniref:Uncharacterized protein n=1 Tax=Plakobranchus ocellatus TaxID=259542 RepID=A0AAV4CLB5_9GAST|nr:hypothetical protein PoB_005880200 [Plakobranchus ocellatus]
MSSYIYTPNSELSSEKLSIITSHTFVSPYNNTTHNNGEHPRNKLNIGSVDSMGNNRSHLNRGHRGDNAGGCVSKGTQKQNQKTSETKYGVGQHRYCLQNKSMIVAGRKLLRQGSTVAFL